MRSAHRQRHRAAEVMGRHQRQALCARDGSRFWSKAMEA
ncbi:MAG: hypothetical protein AVDCRST_MAG62-750 [uncultured Sphingomonas sp.]|uniref:Uncharacterized protein n=1 Tax=uncultured Sphingomonas sp. TaxID=158754 RepID=A0A6J4T6E6_9SPHN|nr:MAG: hypothetical protein AVDCRST_MAG62-750 [uncultured Sphingomonas sp.]